MWETFMWSERGVPRQFWCGECVKNGRQGLLTVRSFHRHEYEN